MVAYPRQKSKRNRLGASTVEFAIMVPIIFTMFIGAIELTRLNFIKQTAANACYEGARKAVTPGGTNTDAQTEASRLLNMLGVGNGASVTVSSTIDKVTVSVSVPVNQNSWGVCRFSSGINVNSSCTLSVESFSR